MKSTVELRFNSDLPRVRWLPAWSRWIALGAAVAALGACTAEIGVDPTESGAGGSGPGTGSGTGGTIGADGKWQPGPCDSAVNSFATARIWQITDKQYVNAVRDVLGITLTGDEAAISGGISNSGEYGNYAEGGGIFTDNTAQNYQTGSLSVARQAITKMTTLIGGTTTTPATTQQLDTFINAKVARLWRRPVSAAEATKLKDLYNSGTNSQDGGPPNAFSLVLQAVLQAPSFLFRTEIGGGSAPSASPVQMTPYEVAGALSMLFLESVPDDTLWTKAQNGSLMSPDVLAAEVDRLMATPQAKENMALKVGYWLWSERVPVRPKEVTLFPEYTAAVQQSVYESGRAFVNDLITNGKLWDVLGSNKVYVNKDISSVYGIPGGTSTTMTAVTTTATERSAGYLTQPAFMAAAHKRPALNDPIHTGLFVIDQLLCGGDSGGPIPEPPANAFEIASMMMGTERELAQQRAKLSCGACHGKIDAFGLTLQAYDAMGRFNANKQVVKDPTSGAPVWKTFSTPIDTSATVPEGTGPDLVGTYANIVELAKRLNSDGPNKRVAYCAGRWLSKYSLGSDPGTLNSCELQKVKQKLYETGSLLEFYRSLATSPAFITRNPG
jgi:Protein of unknown function (DUF1592)/Protein of unknown function (DUF1588)/Protein of unknown function (DUF1595)